MKLAGETIDGNKVLFQISSARIVEKYDENNKHVIYTIQVRHLAGREDLNPITIERRYTQFYNLYCALKQSFPNLLSAISFPRKVIHLCFIPNFFNMKFRLNGQKLQIIIVVAIYNQKLLSCFRKLNQYRQILAKILDFILLLKSFD